MPALLATFRQHRRMRMQSHCGRPLAAFIVLGASVVLVSSGAASATTRVISTGYGTPQTISPGPSGDYLIPDSAGVAASPVWRMAPAGGPPSVFSPHPPNTDLHAGMILPAA